MAIIELNTRSNDEVLPQSANLWALCLSLLLVLSINICPGNNIQKSILLESSQFQGKVTVFVEEHSEVMQYFAFLPEGMECEGYQWTARLFQILSDTACLRFVSKTTVIQENGLLVYSLWRGKRPGLLLTRLFWTRIIALCEAMESFLSPESRAGWGGRQIP